MNLHNAGIVSMKKQTPLVKIAVVASSVVLAAGFICYRAGAFGEISFPAIFQRQPVNSSPGSAAATGEPSADGSNSSEVARDAEKSDDISTGTATPVLVNSPKSPAMMSGSKSVKIQMWSPTPAPK